MKLVTFCILMIPVALMAQEMPLVQPEDAIKSANSWVDSLKTLSAPALLLVFLNLVGVVLKNNKHVDNDWIPWILIALGALGMLTVYPTEDIPYRVCQPWAYKAMLGAVIGAGSVGMHQAISRLMGWEMPRKPDAPPPPPPPPPVPPAPQTP